MKIHKENIDELLFEYFEGNLNDSEKGELMNFIHQHPEFNDDFTSWAQSYAHAHEQPEDYKIADKLMRTDGSSLRISGKAAALYLLLLLSATLLVWFENSTQKNFTDKERSIEGRDHTVNGSLKDLALPNADSGTINGVAGMVMEKYRNKTERKDDSSASLKTTTLPMQDGVPLQQENFSSTLPTIDSIFSTDDKNEPIGKDTARTETKGPVVEKEPTRSRNRINLRPTPKFLPVNKDL